MKNVHFIKQTKLAKQLMFVAAVALTFQSCIKDNFDTSKIAEVKWNPNFAVPLVYSSLTISNILKTNKTSLLQTASDGSMTIIYTTTLASLDASSIPTLKLPDQAPSSYTISTLPITGPIPGGGAVTPIQTQTITFHPIDTTATLDSIVFKAGAFNFSMSSDIQQNIDITIAIPGAKKNGVSFSKTISLNYTGTSPVTASPSYDLTGYDFDLTQGGTTSNTFIVDYTLKVYGPGILLGTEQVQIGASMSNLSYSELFGYFGQQTIIIKTDSVPLSIFKNAVGSASFTLAHPKVKLITYNSFGVPLTVQLPQLAAVSVSSGTINIPNSLPYTIPISSPNINQVGQTATHQDSLTSTNSNIVAAISSTPKNIIYSVNAQTNTGSPSQNNFMLDTSKFHLDVEVDVPLDGMASNFTLVDTLPFTALSGQNISDNVSSVLFRVATSNGFPLDVDMQIYFVDSLYTKLDSLIVPPDSKSILKSGTIDATLRVTSPTPTLEYITIDRTKLKKLSTTKKLLILAKASTTNAGTQEVKIYSNYNLKVQLGMQIQVDVKINPNKK